MNQEEKSNLTRSKITEVSAQLFLQNGYDNTTIQDIMKGTDLSKGALYHHFKSKQEILAYIIRTEQERIAAQFKQVAEKSGFTAAEKIRLLLGLIIANEALPRLTEMNWAEKIPIALLHTLRNTLNVLAVYLTAIIEEGVRQNEFNCRYPREIAEILLLLFDIWLDPVIVKSSYREVCSKLDFIMALLEKFEVPLISPELEKEIKERMKSYYEKV